MSLVGSPLSFSLYLHMCRRIAIAPPEISGFMCLSCIEEERRCPCGFHLLAANISTKMRIAVELINEPERECAARRCLISLLKTTESLATCAQLPWWA